MDALFVKISAKMQTFGRSVNTKRSFWCQGCLQKVKESQEKLCCPQWIVDKLLRHPRKDAVTNMHNSRAGMPDWHQMGKNVRLFKISFLFIWLNEPKWTENWSFKVPDLSITSIHQNAFAQMTQWNYIRTYEQLLALQYLISPHMKVIEMLNAWTCIIH